MKIKNKEITFTFDQLSSQLSGVEEFQTSFRRCSNLPLGISDIYDSWTWFESARVANSLEQGYEYQVRWNEAFENFSPYLVKPWTGFQGECYFLDNSHF